MYTPGISEHHSGTGSLFYNNDALGSVRNIVNSNNAMTDDERFDAFGMTVFHGGQSPTTTPYGFVGKKGYQTDTSGLMLLGHRYYDAGIGRFLSRDPIHDGNNWYAYCGNNPLDKADPSGEQTPEVLEQESQNLPPGAGNIARIGIAVFIAAEGLVQYLHEHPITIEVGPRHWTPPTAHPIPVSRTGPTTSPVRMATQKPMPDRSHEGQTKNWKKIQSKTGLNHREMQQLHDDGYSTREGVSEHDIIKEGIARREARDRKEQLEQLEQDQDQQEEQDAPSKYHQKDR